MNRIAVAVGKQGRLFLLDRTPGRWRFGCKQYDILVLVFRHIQPQSTAIVCHNELCPRGAAATMC